MKKLNGLDWFALVLLIIGGLNWGIIGLFNFNVVGMIFGDASAISRIIYVIVGLSAIYVAFLPSMMSEGEYMGGKMAKSM